MNQYFKVAVVCLTLAVGFSGCEKAEQEMATAAEEAVTEYKARTIDAAREVTGKLEDAGKQSKQVMDDALAATGFDAEANEGNEADEADEADEAE